jgi:cytochrome c peroxidase
LALGCRKDQATDPLLEIPYSPESLVLVGPEGFPQMPIPADNPTTKEGVALGRRLFYDPILSADYTMSCSSCHLPKGNFTDNLRVSEGIDGVAGRRSSMPLVDIGFADQGLFWDGRVVTLEEQALLPVEDTIELHTTWPEVISRLQTHDLYPELFRRAFGIRQKQDITKELAAKAIAQFERSLISSGNSRFDRFFRNELELTDEEYLGYVLFFDLDPNITDAECGHCHNAPLFTTNQYFNNGIESVTDLGSFPDIGRGRVTGDTYNNGQFRAPTLRNIELSAPYMHDGRFNTLEEVIEHYNNGGGEEVVINKDPLIRKLRLDEVEKEALIAFLKTLTDRTFIEDPRYQDPFE